MHHATSRCDGRVIAANPADRSAPRRQASPSRSPHAPGGTPPAQHRPWREMPRIQADVGRTPGSRARPRPDRASRASLRIPGVSAPIQAFNRKLRPPARRKRTSARGIPSATLERRDRDKKPCDFRAPSSARQVPRVDFGTCKAEAGSNRVRRHPISLERGTDFLATSMKKSRQRQSAAQSPGILDRCCSFFSHSRASDGRNRHSGNRHWDPEPCARPSPAAPGPTSHRSPGRRWQAYAVRRGMPRCTVEIRRRELTPLPPGGGGDSGSRHDCRWSRCRRSHCIPGYAVPMLPAQ